MPTTIAEMDELFASPMTGDELKRLWAECKSLGAGKNFQGNEDFLRVRANASLDTAAECHDWAATFMKSGKYVKPEWQGEYEASQERLKSLGGEKVRSWHVTNTTVIGRIIAPESEPFVLAFYFFTDTTTLQDIDDLFASSTTDETMKNLWAQCRKLEGGDDFWSPGFSDHLVAAHELWDIYTLRLIGVKARFGMANCYGDEQFLAKLLTLEKVRLGGIVGQRVSGIFVVHPQELTVLTFFFFVRESFN